jgi:hypothetical protein
LVARGVPAGDVWGVGSQRVACGVWRVCGAHEPKSCRVSELVKRRKKETIIDDLYARMATVATTTTNRPGTTNKYDCAMSEQR